MLSGCSSSFFEYTGFIEGTDVFKGNHELVVCEGFVGNVVLKLAEGLGNALFNILKREVMQGMVRRMGGIFLKGVFRNLHDLKNFEEYGGAMLIGVQSVCTILHGASSARAFTKGIQATAGFCRENIIEQIGRQVSLWKEDAV
jgi:glycerol-3-phosphate acyltransferase PlsX